VDLIDKNLDPKAGGAASGPSLGLCQAGAKNGQIVRVVSDFVGGHSSIPGFRFPAMSSQPRAVAQSMQMQVPTPSITTGAR